MKQKLMLLCILCSFVTGIFAQAEFSYTSTTGFNDNGTMRYSSCTYSTWSNVDTISAELNELDKPIIVVEGYDALDAFNSEEVYDLLNGIDGNFLAERLRALGYDLIIVDFNLDNNKHIQQNAMLVMDLINEVNNQKISNEPLVVLGVSMGGLITRYALAYMEENNIPHQTRLFGTFDTPHRGANISPPSQLAVNDFRNNPLLLGLTNGQSLMASLELDAPAVRQMLIYHEPSFDLQTSSIEIPDAHQMHEEFYNELRGLNSGTGYPQQCRKIAIANGVKTGLLQQDINNVSFGFRLAIQATHSSNAFSMDIFSWPDVSNFSPSDTLASLYSRFLVGTGQTFRNINIKNVLPVDNCPGGTTPVYFEMNDVISNITGVTSTLTTPNTTFIPTMSALDLEGDLLTNISQDYTLQCQIPFDAFYAPLLQNQGHTDLPIYTANWLFEQITEQDWTITQTNNKSFNFGQNTTDIISRNVEVRDNGEFFINNAWFTGFFRANINAGINLNLTPQPVDSSVFVVATSGCKGQNDINVKSNGRMLIGSRFGWRSGHVYIKENDNLNIQSNGLCQIRANSRLFADQNGTIRIQQGGELELEDDAELVVNDGGVVIIENGGNVLLENNTKIRVRKGGELFLSSYNQLNVIDQAQIIIEEGGSLRYNENSSIALANTNNTLTVQGKLALEDDAIFTYSGNGHLVFDQNVWKTDPNTGQAYQALDEFWEIGDDAEFILDGGQVFTDVIMETKKSFVPRMEDGTTFSKMTFKRGKILIGESAPLHCFTALDMQTVEVNSSDPNTKHDGFRIHYNPGTITIENVRFKNGKKSLIAHWYGSTQPLKLNNVLFEDNDIGFFADRGNFQITQSDFYNNLYGIEGNVITGASTIANSDFNGNATGFSASGQVGTSIATTGCNFINNDKGVLARDLGYTSKCSKFVNHSTSGIEIEDATLYINDDAQNQFYNNQNAIYLSGFGQSTGIYLDNGNNEFGLGNQGATYFYNNIPTKAYIKALVRDVRPTSQYHTPTGKIWANNNKMPIITINPITPPNGGPATTVQYVLPVDIQYRVGGGPQGFQDFPVHLHIPNNLSSVTNACNNIDPLDGSLPALGVVNAIRDPGFLITGGRFAGNTVKEALLLAIPNITVGEEEQDDLTALDDLQEILLQKSSSTDADENDLLQIGYDLLHMAMGNAYKFGQLTNTANNAQSVEREVQRSIDIMDDMLSGLLNSANATYYAQNFNLELDKAQTYRLGGYYNEAMAVLSKQNQWATGTDLLRTGFWTCICKAERDYVDGTIDAERLMTELEQCNTTYKGYNFKKGDDPFKYSFQIMSSTDDNLKLSLYPQPATGKVQLELNGSYAGSMMVTIHDVTGRQVLSQNIKWDGISQTLDIKGLPAGTYMIKAIIGHSSITEKLIVE